MRFPLNKQTQLQQILQYIGQEYAKEITLAHLARRFEWSERHLQRLFKEHTGQTFLHYLQNVRIQQSCELLARHPLSPLPVIAEQVGYHDLKSFNAVFKRITGKPPGAYRQALNKSGDAVRG